MVAHPRALKPDGTALTEMQEAVLGALLDAFPDGLSRGDLVARHGDTAPSRVGELRRMGWRIPKGELRGGKGYYRLTSTTKGEADPTLAGCVLRLGGATGWEARTHHEAELPGDVLQEAEEAASEAYRQVLRARGYGHLLGEAGPDLEPPGARGANPVDPAGYDDELDDLDSYVARFGGWHEED